MEKKVLVIKGESQYNVLRTAADEIAKGFVQRGYQVEVMDMLMDDNRQIVYRIINESYSFIFSCQGLYFKEFFEDGTPYIERVKSPYIGWIFDDMLYHLPRVMNQVYDHTFLLFTDEEMQDISYSMFPQVKNLASLLHGGFVGKGEDVEKDIDVLFPSSIGEKPVLESFIKDPLPIERLLIEETIKQLHETPTLSVRKALEVVLNRLGEELSGDFLKELLGVTYYVDAYIRYECRYQIMEELLKNDIQLYVVGNGNSDLFERYKDNITVTGGLDIDEVARLIQRSKIVINPLPVVFYKGAHERIFTAMLNRAICFTPYSEFLDDMMGDKLQFIDMHNLPSMVDGIKDILNRYEMDDVQKMLDYSWEYAMTNHTWEIRGQEIVDFFESIYGV